MAKDVGALRGSMAAVTSKAEAAMATSEALQDEVGRLSEEAHRTAGHLGALATEVRLPSGFLLPCYGHRLRASVFASRGALLPLRLRRGGIG